MMEEDTRTLTDACAQMLPNREQSQLFDAIDTLRNFNRKGLDLPVPQVVVLGDQSSGKSSVLESLARISLPVGTSVCTRFPIELALRYDPLDSLEMEILPGPSRGRQEKATYDPDSFRKRTTNPGNVDVSRWIQDAAETIGVAHRSDSSEKKSPRSYSDDIVRIVRRGPEMVDLTLVDLPGLFQTTTETQTEEDKSKVEEISLCYATDHRSLILLVCSAHNDFSVNGTPRFLDGRFSDRTMGILTHSDSMDKKDRIMKLIQGEAKGHAELGWHFLINRSEEQRRDKLSFEQRDQNERDIFNAQLADIPPEMRGICELRQRVGNHLLRYIRNCLPELIRSAMKAERRHRTDLENMPPPRGTEPDQRKYLFKEAVKFVGLARAATYPHYSEHLSFFGDYDDQFEPHPRSDRKKASKRRLQSTIRELNRIFAIVMKDHGPRIRVSDTDASAPGTPDNRDHLSETSDLSSESNRSAHAGSYEDEGQSETGQPADDDSRGAYEQAESDNWSSSFLPKEMWPKYEIPAGDIITMTEYEELIEEKQNEWLGKGPRSEISTDLYLAVIYKQTAEWGRIALTHLGSVLQATRGFIDEALEYNLPKDIGEKVMKYIITPRLRRLQISTKQRLDELLDCHRKEAHAFLDALPSFAPSEEPTIPIPTSIISDLVSTLARSAQSDQMYDLLNMLNSGDHEGDKAVEQGNVAIQILETVLAKQIPQPLIRVLKTFWSEARGSEMEKTQKLAPEREAAQRLIDHTDRFYKVNCCLFLLIDPAALTKLCSDDSFQFRRVCKCDDCGRSDHEGTKRTNFHHGNCR
jgi:hypothetical protein